MLTHFIILVPSFLGIGENGSDAKPINGTKPGIEVSKLSSYNDKTGANRNDWDYN